MRSKIATVPLGRSGNGPSTTLMSFRIGKKTILSISKYAWITRSSSDVGRVIMVHTFIVGWKGTSNLVFYSDFIKRGTRWKG